MKGWTQGKAWLSCCPACANHAATVPDCRSSSLQPAPPPTGPILITHFTLLLGMAAPVWLSNALDGPACGASGGCGLLEAPQTEQQRLWPAALAGIMILGGLGCS